MMLSRLLNVLTLASIVLCAETGRYKRAGETCTTNSNCKSRVCDNSTTPAVCMAASFAEGRVGEPCSESQNCATFLCDKSSVDSRSTCIKFYSKKTGETCVSDV